MLELASPAYRLDPLAAMTSRLRLPEHRQRLEISLLWMLLGNVIFDSIAEGLEAALKSHATFEKTEFTVLDDLVFSLAMHCSNPVDSYACLKIGRAHLKATIGSI